MGPVLHVGRKRGRCGGVEAMTDRIYLDGLIQSLNRRIGEDNVNTVHHLDPEMIVEYIEAFTRRFKKELKDRGFPEDADISSFDPVSEEYLIAGIVHFGELVLSELAYLESGEADADSLIFASVVFGLIRQSLTYHVGALSNEQTISELALHGASFSKHKTSGANRARTQKKINRDEHLIATARKLLRQGVGRKKNGSINKKKLAESCLVVIGPILKITRARGLISKAIRTGELTE
jgi:hypothetical protein